MDSSLSTHQNYINRPISDLPTPAFILSRPVLETNIKRLHADVEQLGIDFRPHVKTLKVRTDFLHDGHTLTVSRSRRLRSRASCSAAENIARL